MLPFMVQQLVLPFLYEEEKVPLFLCSTSLWTTYFHELLDIKDCYRRLVEYHNDKHFEQVEMDAIPSMWDSLSNSSVSS